MIRASILTLLFATACRTVDWTPDPLVLHSDTSFVSGGERIEVERMAPRGRGRHAAVLVLAPSDGTESSGGDYVRRYADGFARRGYVAFVVHYFDRTHTINSDDRLEDETYPVWTSTLRDAVGFAQADRAVEPRRIGAFGFSLGGYMALALGATDPRVRGLVVLSGGFFRSLAPRVTRLPPTLLLHGSDDDIVPLADARRVDSTLARLGSEHELVVYQGEGHGLSDARDPDAARRAAAFFDRTLRGRRLSSLERSATAAAPVGR
jgi:dienelactone hydrolase